MTDDWGELDDDVERPVPMAWRAVLERIVAAFAEGDYRLVRGIDGVAPVSAETAAQVQAYIRDYGATLTRLAPASWETSVAARSAGGWDVLVDLWTEEEGRSDLVLHAHATDGEDGPWFSVRLVYVP